MLFLKFIEINIFRWEGGRSYEQNIASSDTNHTAAAAAAGTAAAAAAAAAAGTAAAAAAAAVTLPKPTTNSVQLRIFLTYL